MKNIKKLLMGALGVLVVATLISGCGSDNRDMSKDMSKKVLRVGTEAAYPPFEFTKDNSDALQGFDIEIMEALAKRMGYTVEWHNIGFDALIPAITSDQLDVAISGMSITEERKKIVNFTDAYYEAASTVVHKKGDGITNMKDLEGKTVAAQIGTTGADEAHAIPNVTVKEFNNVPDLLTELSTGGSQAAIIDGPCAAYYLKLDPGKYEVFPTGTPPTPIGMAVSKNKPELLKDLNKALADMKRDGEFDKIAEKWFGKAEK